jgi:hypothetical protein
MILYLLQNPRRRPQADPDPNHWATSVTDQLSVLPTQGLVVAIYTTECLIAQGYGILAVQLPCHGDQPLKTTNFRVQTKMDFV